MSPFDSIYSNNIQALREYLELGDVNITNERGMSLLHAAIVFSNSEIFDLLLESYINVNIKDNHGDTPSHYCVVNNKMGYLKMLIRHNADLNIKNDEGKTPLYKACSLGRENMVSLLLESVSFNIYEKDNNDETMFMALVRSRNLDLLKKVICDEKIVDMPNYKGEAPLHIASKSGDIKVIQYLIEHNAFINSKNNLNETPIFYAIKYQNLDAVDILLKHGAIMDCKNKMGDTAYDLIPKEDMAQFIEEKVEKYKTNLYGSNFPLHYAIMVEDYELVKKNCTIRNIHREDPFGFSPKDLVLKYKNDRIKNIVLQMSKN